MTSCNEHYIVEKGPNEHIIVLPSLLLYRQLFVESVSFFRTIFPFMRDVETVNKTHCCNFKTFKRKLLYMLSTIVYQMKRIQLKFALILEIQNKIRR